MRAWPQVEVSPRSRKFLLRKLKVYYFRHKIREGKECMLADAFLTRPGAKNQSSTYPFFAPQRTSKTFRRKKKTMYLSLNPKPFGTHHTARAM